MSKPTLEDASDTIECIRTGRDADAYAKAFGTVSSILAMVLSGIMTNEQAYARVCAIADENEHPNSEPDMDEQETDSRKMPADWIYEAAQERREWERDERAERATNA